MEVSYTLAMNILRLRESPKRPGLPSVAITQLVTVIKWIIQEGDSISILNTKIYQKTSVLLVNEDSVIVILVSVDWYQ